jgi:hypothetical protein
MHANFFTEAQQKSERKGNNGIPKGDNGIWETTEFGTEEFGTEELGNVIIPSEFLCP